MVNLFFGKEAFFMQYWLDTTETIADGVGFSHYDSCHLAWLAGFVIFTVLSCLVYRRLEAPGRRRMPIF